MDPIFSPPPHVFLMTHVSTKKFRKPMLLFSNFSTLVVCPKVGDRPYTTSKHGSTRPEAQKGAQTDDFAQQTAEERVPRGARTLERTVAGAENWSTLLF
jgi:hypothetical protein